MSLNSTWKEFLSGGIPALIDGPTQGTSSASANPMANPNQYAARTPPQPASVQNATQPSAPGMNRDVLVYGGLMLAALIGWYLIAR